jgi:hypothetical protein
VVCSLGTVVAKLERFILYETTAHLYLVASDKMQVRRTPLYTRFTRVETRDRHVWIENVSSHGLILATLGESLQLQFRLLKMDRKRPVRHRTRLCEIVTEV